MVSLVDSGASITITGGTSATVPLPLGTSTGDWQIACLQFTDNASALAGLSADGWSLTSYSPMADTVSAAYLATRFLPAGAVETPISWTTASKVSIATLVYTGVGSVEAHNGAISFTPTTAAVTPSVTTAGAPVVACFTSRTSTTANKNPTWTAAPELIEQVSINNSAATSSPWSAVTVQDTNGAAVSAGAHSYTSNSNFSESRHTGTLFYLLGPSAPPPTPDEGSYNASAMAAMNPGGFR